MTGQRVVLEDVATITNDLEKPVILSRTEGDRSINIVVRTNNGDITDISNSIEDLIARTKEYSDDISIKVVRNFGKYIDSLLLLFQIMPTLVSYLYLLPS